MRKIHGIILGVFLGGVLLYDIGTGMAFAEYSEMDYGGEQLLGAENLVTKELDYTFSPEENRKIVLYPCWFSEQDTDSLVVEDESIPEGVIRYQVTYNEEMINVWLSDWQEEAEATEAMTENLGCGSRNCPNQSADELSLHEKCGI